MHYTTSLRSTSRRVYCRARGLAPVELVMWLPIFVLLAALMVNLGTMQAWRMRGEVAARNAAMGARWPQQPWHFAPPPDHWQGVAYDAAFVAPPAELEPTALRSPALRGPLAGIAVRPMLDANLLRSVVGQARVRRALPLIRSAPPYDSAEIRHIILNGTWTAWEMPLAANTLRRTKELYGLPLGGAP